MHAKEGPPSLNSSSSNNTQDNHFLRCTERPTGTLVWSVFCSISFFLGILASLILLRELLQRRGRGAFIDIFMLILSFIDLTFTVALLPIVYNYMVLHSEQISQFSAFMHGFAMCGRPLLMTCICGECYFAVIHPIAYKTCKNGTKIRNLVSLTVLLITIGFSSLLVIQEEAFSTPLVSAPLIVALPVITFFDTAVFRALRRPSGPSGNSNIHPQKKRALHIIANSFIMTVTVYLPPAIFFTFADVLPMSKGEYFCSLTFYGISFCTAGCVIMPVLYLDTMGKLDHFKAWLKRRVFCPM